MKRILSVQDVSCVGQCSLTVALPIISAFGVEVSILPSAVLSTHTGGFSGFTFHDLTADFPKILQHWEKEGIKFDGLYTGYIGNPEQIPYILEIADGFLNSGAKVFIDPAMADFGKLYKGFDEKFVSQMKALVKIADFVLPNITEAALLTGTEYIERGHSIEYAEALCRGMCNLGAKTVILKGVTTSDGEIGVATFDGSMRVHTHERIEKSMHGTGDVYAACFVGAYLSGFSPERAASVAADLTLSAIKKTIPDESHWYGVKFEQIIPEIVNLNIN